ncbi:substrate-binding domain-containing protein [Oceaniglobus indicus]|uniref:substrate-binding domain-containing protein n=1 Tax=Oceaniglobus indicus TaxID=2047749 RepID=UPI000C1A04B0|nr:substrate-binding domain-containing protein [Oceaniglobus indicus]
MTLAKLTVWGLAVAAATSASARDQVQVAGSSTVLPYASIVAEAFGENFDFPTPVVESGGSSAGLKKFCEGVGESTIDVANSSRPMRPRERMACVDNGVSEIIEVRIGYDGIVFASRVDGPDFTAFTPQQWYDALAANIPVDGAMIANPNQRWSDVDPALPDVDIITFIPGTKHGTREVFEEKVMLMGCEHGGALAAMIEMGMDEDTAERACMNVRTDGKAVDIDGDYTETLARIESNPEGVGVFGLSFYESNTAVLKDATINGVTASTETIASGEYPVSRPLFFYVKKAHIGVIPGLKDYAAFFVADPIAGPGGPLSDYGLTPDPDLAATQEMIANETPMAHDR